MTALLVVLMFVAFVLIDIAVREMTRRMKQKKERQQREEVLNVAVRQDFTHEAKSLKRVEVPEAKARILAVDDEAVVLDSFRRILVLEGFNIDTVETGQEALGLLQLHDYDFVFTDLKMPGMDGVEVVKAVKHMRPDLDVVVITGYATIETAVETMRDGASEYVQKPFTADELADFVRKLMIKREARLESQRRPTVSIVAPSAAETAPEQEFTVPGGAFIAKGHLWARIEPSGQVRVGLDDFARKALGPLTSVTLPQAGKEVRQGDPLFTAERGGERLTFMSPVSGKVASVNGLLGTDPSPIHKSPYDKGWVLRLEPADLAAEIPGLRIGKPVVDWYQEEITRLREAAPNQEKLSGETLQKLFF